jgi:hypothetical protein
VEEALFAGEEEKRRERNDGQLTLSSVVENEASDFFCSLRPPSPSITEINIKGDW